MSFPRSDCMKKIGEYEMDEKKVFEKEDLQNWQPYLEDYFMDILNGDYELSQAREDLEGLIEAGKAKND